MGCVSTFAAIGLLFVIMGLCFGGKGDFGWISALFGLALMVVPFAIYKILDNMGSSRPDRGDTEHGSP